jgi:SatD family protein
MVRMPRPRPAATYVALIGDVVASRDLPAKPRAELQSQLRAWLESLNGELGPALAAPLTLTAGDEIQGLFRKPGALVRVVQDLADRMGQLEHQPWILFGVGRGELTTGPIPRPPARATSPAMLDGPAFHNARTALEHAQDEGGWARFLGFGEAPDFVLDLVLDALFGLMGTIRERWTVSQARMSGLMRGWPEAAEPSQRELAARLKVSPSVVSETLKAARHPQLLQGEHAARCLLETLER